MALEDRRVLTLDKGLAGGSRFCGALGRQVRAGVLDAYAGGGQTARRRRPPRAGKPLASGLDRRLSCTHVDLERRLRSIIDDSLGLRGRAASFDPQTPLLGALPELDSMGVVAIITALENQLGVEVDDDEIDGSVFATWGSLLGFVQSKLNPR